MQIFYFWSCIHSKSNWPQSHVIAKRVVWKRDAYDYCCIVRLRYLSENHQLSEEEEPRLLQTLSDTDAADAADADADAADVDADADAVVAEPLNVGIF